jgi:hypothetical protein
MKPFRLTKILFSFLLFGINNTALTQNKTINVTVFSNKTFAILNIQDKNIHNPSGGNDSISFRAKLVKINDKLYTFQFLEINGGFLLYSKDFIQSLVFPFELNKNKQIQIKLGLDSLQKSLKKLNDLKYGKDTTSFGEYYGLMSNPSLLISSTFMPYIELIHPFINNAISEVKGKTMVPVFDDSTIANFTTKIKLANGVIHVTSETQTDSLDAKAFIYKNKIKKHGDMFKKSFKVSDMIYIPTNIIVTAIGEKSMNSNEFLIKSIIRDHRINLGNPFDRINIINIKFE